MNDGFWRGRRVLVTGHTGFKGSWLTLILGNAGAVVHGYALAPPTEPNLFTVANAASALATHATDDIRNAERLERALSAAAPEVVFHLAAQPLVRYSYREPLETYAVNVMGTANLLECVRRCTSVRAVVNVTTDKCYENKEWSWGYRENEPLGGRDPYSSSKACAELVTAAFRDSYLAARGVGVATARAGNVIGGGDWATDRLIPDFLRAADAAAPLDVRFPAAVRPWQHVLESLSGYMLLAEQLATPGNSLAGAWNFGPSDEDARPVSWVLDYLRHRVAGTSWRDVRGDHPHEAGYLKLDSSKARTQLGWRPRWPLAKALDMTLEWHRAWREGGDMHAVCLSQIGAHRGEAS